MTQVPSFDQLMVPLFTALRELGGSASIAEIDDKVGELLELPEEVLELPHNPEKSNQSEFQYRLAWARTYLKQYGLIDNSRRGVWVIAPSKRKVTEFDPQDVIRDFRGAMVGRADKGLLITTGTFTRDAIREATRDGAPPLDLIDGDQLADMLKELNLGIQTEVVEQVSVDQEWFRTL